MNFKISKSFAYAVCVEQAIFALKMKVGRLKSTDQTIPKHQHLLKFCFYMILFTCKFLDIAFESPKY